MTIKISTEQARVLERIAKNGPCTAASVGAGEATIRALVLAEYIIVQRSKGVNFKEYVLTEIGWNFLRIPPPIAEPIPETLTKLVSGYGNISFGELVDKVVDAATDRIRHIDDEHHCPCCGGSGHINDVASQTRVMLNVEWKFTLGNRVSKMRGARWQGRVVGFYSTALNPRGYCVESENEPGSVQIYPEAALELVE